MTPRSVAVAAKIRFDRANAEAISKGAETKRFVDIEGREIRHVVFDPDNIAAKTAANGGATTCLATGAQPKTGVMCAAYPEKSKWPDADMQAGDVSSRI